MNITTNNVEVSTPFFHENNTAAMNSYEDPVKSKASLVQSKASLVQSDPAENTFAYVLQTSIYHAARMKEFDEECACGYRCIARYGSILCRAILNKATEEYEKLEKSKEIIMQQIRPMPPMDSQSMPFGTEGLMGEGGVGLRSVRSAPTPWRWENRTAVPVKERGKCLLYHPVPYMQAFDKHRFDMNTFDRRTFDQHTIEQHMSLQTPLCFLHENDVVDNGTVMCLGAVGNECIYGNETMKAMLKFEGLYPPKIASETSWLIVFAILVMIVVGALTHKPK